MQLKKINLVVLFILLIQLPFHNTVLANNNSYLSYTPYDFAVKVLTNYYMVIDQNSVPDFSNNIYSDDIKTYTQLKMDGKSYKSKVYGVDDKENYNINFELLEETKNKDYIQLTIASNITFNYKNSILNSGYGEIIHLQISQKNDSYQIIDWYIPSDSYDVELRESAMNFQANNLSSITSKQIELNNEIKAYYDNLATDKIPSVIDNIHISYASPPYYYLCNLI